MSLLQISKFYQKASDVETYNRTRSCLPDSVGQRIISELRKKRNADENDKFDLMADVGCGAGRHTKLFAHYFERIVGFDVIEEQIQRAQLDRFDHVTYVVGSGEAMPLADESVDLAVFIFSAYFMEMENVEKELERVLKPDGLAIIYGDAVNAIDLLDNTGRIGTFSELTQEPIELWNKICMDPVVEFARKTQNPMKRFMDKYEAIFQEIQSLQKRKTEFLYHEETTLEDLISHFCPGIPIFANFAELQSENPFDVFARELKKTWNISNMKNRDINLRLTRGSFMIILEKETAYLGR